MRQWCSSTQQQMLGRELDAVRMRSVSPDECAAWPPPSSRTTFFPSAFLSSALLSVSLSFYFPFIPSVCIARSCDHGPGSSLRSDALMSFFLSLNMNHASDIPSESAR